MRSLRRGRGASRFESHAEVEIAWCWVVGSKADLDLRGAGRGEQMSPESPRSVRSSDVQPTPCRAARQSVRHHHCRSAASNRPLSGEPDALAAAVSSQHRASAHRCDVPHAVHSSATSIRRCSALDRQGLALSVIRSGGESSFRHGVVSSRGYRWATSSSVCWVQ